MTTTTTVKTVFATSALAALSALRFRKRCLSTLSTLPPVCPVKGQDVTFGACKGENRGPNPMTPPKLRFDPYFWLRDDTRSDKTVQAQIEKENQYTAHMTKHLAAKRDEVYEDYLYHLKETDDTVPYPYGDWLYYSRTVKGLSYRIYCRKKQGQEEQVILDMNEIAKGKKHCDLGCYALSPDHNTMVYTIDDSGNETYDVYLRDLRTGKDTPNAQVAAMPKVGSRVLFGASEKELYYVTLDESLRQDKVWRMILGSDTPDECLLHETDGLFSAGFSKTRSGRFMLLGAYSTETHEYRVVDLNKGPRAEPVLFDERKFGLRYDLDHHGDHFYMTTNADKSTNQKVMRCPVDQCGMANSQDVIPYDNAVTIEDIHCFNNFIALEGREKGNTRIWLLTDLKEKNGKLAFSRHAIEFPEEIYGCEVNVNKNFNASAIRVGYSSMVTPRTIYDYDVAKKENKLLKETQVPHYDRKLYAVKRLEATARDGKTKIPMSMVYRKDVFDPSKPSPVPLELYGYGSYGVCIDPEFSATRITKLNYGMVFVIAHIRGGGELGISWYEDEGKYLKKKNTFTDFVDCAKDLIGRKYTEPSKLAISGGSAGGLLMGNVINMNPELFKVCYTRVPFVDLMNTMCDPSIPLTTIEWEEWGNPNEEKYHQYMLEYSPYDNVTAQDYPAIMITSGYHDPRVAYWEPLKWTARLRSRKTDDNPLLLKIDMDSGHFSASDKYKHLKEDAFNLAFVLDQLGLLHVKSQCVLEKKAGK